MRIEASIAAVVDLLERVDLGAPRRSGALTLYPVFAAAPAKDYLIGADAFGSGLLTIEEIGHGDVPNVAVTNQASLPVLLIDGEHLVGAKQNRILNVTVLLPAAAKTTLPVACVEEHRWSYTSDAAADIAFKVDVDHAYTSLRRSQAEATVLAARTGRIRRADQGQVWADVALTDDVLGAHSPTRSLKQSYDVHRVRIDETRAALGDPAPQQTGMLVCLAGRPLALDLFDRPETLAKMWSRLLSGYVLDALAARPEPEGPGAPESFLAEARAATMISHPGIGLGADVTIASGSLIGSALVWEEAIPHLALFGRHAPGDAPGDAPGRIASPTARRSRFFHQT